MDSIHAPSDSVTPPSDKRGFSLLDGCPSCVTNTETPRDTQPTASGFHCAYRCTDCGHAWTTDWSV